MYRKYFYFLIFCSLALSLPAQVYKLEDIPNPKASPTNHYVSNPAGVLSAQSVAWLDQRLKSLEDSTTAQVAVVALPSIGDAIPKDFAHQLFQRWGIGYAKRDNGLLVLLIVDQRRVEFETGYGLEGVLPDIVCARIQRNEMVPHFKQGDYSAGMMAGIETVCQLIENPAATQEVYDQSKFQDQSSWDRLSSESLLVFGAFFCFIMLALWLFRWIIRSSNPVKKEIDAAIYQNKGHIVFGLWWYIAVPMGIILVFVWFDEAVHVAFHEAIVIAYAYLAFILWDSRTRREAKFRTLYGQLSEPDQYVRLDAATNLYWLDGILFPFPHIWLWWHKRQQLNTLRNHPRNGADGRPLYKVTNEEKLPWLTPYQTVEDKLKTVEYDVWRSASSDEVLILKYPRLIPGKFKKCAQCQSVAYYHHKTETKSAATTAKAGLALHHFVCKACGATGTKEVVLPRLQASSQNNGRSYTSSGRSWSGGSSWGGGRSGGGGAGSSW